MFEKLLNAKVCKLQTILSAKWGCDDPRVINLIRELTDAARKTRNTACFDEVIKAHS